MLRVAQRGRAGRNERPRTRAASVVVPFPRTVTGDRLELGSLVPSGRSLLIAFGVLGGVLLALVLARETSLFAVRTIEVTGAGTGVERQVRKALDDRAGESLFGLDLEEARVDVAALPTVASVSFDRAYPHTLRVTIVPERPVAVVRQGASSFVVSERGRVVARVDRKAKPDLARIWIGKDVQLDPGAFVEGDLAHRRRRRRTARRCPVPEPGRLRHDHGRADAPPPLRPRAPPGRHAGTST